MSKCPGGRGDGHRWSWLMHNWVTVIEHDRTKQFVSVRKYFTYKPLINCRTITSKQSQKHLKYNRYWNKACLSYSTYTLIDQNSTANKQLKLASVALAFRRHNIFNGIIPLKLNGDRAFFASITRSNHRTFVRWKLFLYLRLLLSALVVLSREWVLVIEFDHWFGWSKVQDSVQLATPRLCKDSIKYI